MRGDTWLCVLTRCLTTGGPEFDSPHICFDVLKFIKTYVIISFYNMIKIDIDMTYNELNNLMSYRFVIVEESNIVIGMFV